jgi:hypothetical protein
MLCSQEKSRFNSPGFHADNADCAEGGGCAARPVSRQYGPIVAASEE